MADKYKITDSPKSWRLRNCVEVPEEYLHVLRKKDNGVLIVCLLAMIFVFSCGMFTGYDFGFFAGVEDSSEQISQLEDRLDSLKVSYWKQVTLSEYLAMESFDFETERVHSGKGAVLLVGVNRSTYFGYACLDDGIWSCGLTEYNSTSIENHPSGGGGVVHMSISDLIEPQS